MLSILMEILFFAIVELVFKGTIKVIKKVVRLFRGKKLANGIGEGRQV